MKIMRKKALEEGEGEGHSLEEDTIMELTLDAEEEMPVELELAKMAGEEVGALGESIYCKTSFNSPHLTLRPHSTVMDLKNHCITFS